MANTNHLKVYDFHNCFSHKISTKLYTEIFNKEPKLVKLRCDLINEEINELVEAINTNNIVEIIDALSDILYVVYGYFICLGVDADKEYTNFINKNIKVYNSHSLIEDNTITNYNKTIYIFPKINNITITHYNFNNNNYLFKNNITTLLSNIKKYNIVLKTNSNNKEFDKVVDSLLNILKYTYKFGIYIGLDLDKSFDIVHRSNMTKICETEELAIKTVKWYKNNNKYDSPSYKNSDYGFIIYNKSSNKILKSIEYTPANFE